MLVVGVAEHRVTGAEVDRGDPGRREAGDVGPPVLGADPSPAGANGRDKLGGQRRVQAGSGRRAEVVDDDVNPPGSRGDDG